MYILASCGFFGDVNMAANIGDRYPDLIQKSVQNAIHGESQVEAAIAALLQRIRHPYLTRRGGWSWPSRAQTMIGEKRLANLRELVDRTLSENIPGDYIETGVWRGGACILIRAILEARGVTERKVFLADSFEGLPRPNPERYPADKRDLFCRAEMFVLMRLGLFLLADLGNDSPPRPIQYRPVFSSRVPSWVPISA